jgi:hypothetical protein
MPIEIKELIVRATVDTNAQTGESGISQNNTGKSTVDEDRIVARCMEQLLEYLKMQGER